MANPIASSGLTYDASLSKIIPITGNHSLQIKGTSYGDRYPHYAEYSENTSSFAALYRFNNANTTVSLGPQLELKTVNEKRRYLGMGGRIDADYQFTPIRSKSCCRSNCRTKIRSRLLNSTSSLLHVTRTCNSRSYRSTSERRRLRRCNG